MAFLKSQRKRAVRVRTSEKTAERTIDHVREWKLCWVVVHEVSHRPVKRGKKMPKKSAMFGLKWGASPLLDNKEYNSRIMNR